MQLYTFLVISRSLIDSCIYGNKNDKANIKECTTGKIANEIYKIEVMDGQGEMWLMEYDYTNFGHLDGDIENYFGAVILDKDTIVSIVENFPQKQKRKSKWSITNDTKTYVRNAYRAKDNIDEMLLVEFVDLALYEDDELEDEKIKDKVLILKNLNKREKIRIGGNLSLYYKRNESSETGYYRLLDVIAGTVGDHLHKGHKFDYRKCSVQQFIDYETIDAREEKEKSSGVIRGKLITHSLSDASHSVEGDIDLLFENESNLVSGVLVIDTMQELINLYEHLTSDLYQKIIE